MIELLELIKDYVKNYKIDISKINFDVLLSNKETILNDIIEESDINRRIALIYLYSNATFLSEENKYKESLVEYFKTLELKDFQLKNGIKVATNEDVLKRADAKEILDLIVSAKEDYQAQNGTDVATDKGVLARKDTKEIIRLIVNAKGIDQAQYGSIVARSKAVLVRDNYREILDLIVTAKEEYQAKYGSYVAQDKGILSRDDYREILDLIVTAKEEYQAKNGSYVAQDKGILSRDDYREILDLIVTDNERYDKYRTIIKIIDEETKEETKSLAITDLFKAQFKVDEYISFMDTLENSSKQQINQFVKRFNN